MMTVKNEADTDPSKTIKIRKGIAAQVQRNYREMLAQAEAKVATWPQDEPVAVARIYELRAILGVIAGGHLVSGWYDPYIRASYLRGITTANLDLRAGGYRPDGAAAALEMASHQLALAMQGSKAHAILRDAVNDALAAAQLAMLEGAGQQEKPPGVLARAKAALVAGARQTAVLAATAVVGVVAEAFLNRLVDFGIALVSPVIEAQFTTAGDARVCARCDGLATNDQGNGPGVYTIAQARGMIPVHPRCRCAWRAVILQKPVPLLRFR